MRCDILLIYFQFTFAKLWLLFAQFEIREKDLKRARQAMVSFRNNYHFLLTNKEKLPL